MTQRTAHTEAQRQTRLNPTPCVESFSTRKRGCMRPTHPRSPRPVRLTGTRAARGSCSSQRAAFAARRPGRVGSR
eukprot:6480037-Prymnesium_polylepis.1